MKNNNNKSAGPETSTTMLRDLKNNPDSIRWQEFVRIYTPFFKNTLRSINAKNNLYIKEDYFDDIIQEVFIVLVKQFASFEYDRNKGHFKSFLYKIVFNKAMKFNEMATRNYREIIEENINAKRDENSALRYREEALEKENQEVVQELFQLIMERIFASGKFTEESKTIFLKLVSEEATVDELAEQYNKSTNTIYQIKNRILKAIHERQETIMSSNNNLLDLLESMLKEDLKNGNQ